MCSENETRQLSSTQYYLANPSKKTVDQTSGVTYLVSDPVMRLEFSLEQTFILNWTYLPLKRPVWFFFC